MVHKNAILEHMDLLDLLKNRVRYYIYKVVGEFFLPQHQHDSQLDIFRQEFYRVRSCHPYTDQKNDRND
jgi:hypothetical protein